MDDGETHSRDCSRHSFRCSRDIWGIPSYLYREEKGFDHYENFAGKARLVRSQVFDHVRVIGCMSFHSDNRRAFGSWTPLCYSIELNERFDKESLVALMEFLVGRQQFEDLFVVNDLLAA